MLNLVTLHRHHPSQPPHPTFQLQAGCTWGLPWPSQLGQEYWGSPLAKDELLLPPSCMPFCTRKERGRSFMIVRTATTNACCNPCIRLCTPEKKGYSEVWKSRSMCWLLLHSWKEESCSSFFQRIEGRIQGPRQLAWLCSLANNGTQQTQPRLQRRKKEPNMYAVST